MGKIFGNRLIKKEKLANLKIEFIYGGSFDPLHKGHVNLVERVVENIKKLTKDTNHNISFRFLPCATPALKKASVNDFSFRSKQLQKVFKNYFLNQNIKMLVDEREGVRSSKDGEKSYTIDSLKELSYEAISNKNIANNRFLIVGADNFNSLHRWNSYRELSSLCNLLLVNRAGESLHGWVEKAENYGFTVNQEINQLLNTKIAGQCYYMEISEVDISSTEIREKIEANQPVDDWLI